MKIFNEALLEPLIRYLRFHVALSDMPTKVDICVDLGCGPNIPFYRYMQSRGVTIERYVGIDPLLDLDESKRYSDDRSVQLIARKGEDVESIESASVGIVTAFAFLEHVDDPRKMIREVIRILKPGGKAILTTPTKRAKPILEFLAFQLHVVSEREIAEHKNYFNRDDIYNLIPQSLQDSIALYHRYFELGCNNYFVITK